MGLLVLDGGHCSLPGEYTAFTHDLNYHHHDSGHVARRHGPCAHLTSTSPNPSCTDVLRLSPSLLPPLLPQLSIGNTRMMAVVPPSEVHLLSSSLMERALLDSLQYVASTAYLTAGVAPQAASLSAALQWTMLEGPVAVASITKVCA
jgi:hypothetical protein